eukprot:7600172-Heterocapsa_arctica.AAC.1
MKEGGATQGTEYQEAELEAVKNLAAVESRRKVRDEEPKAKATRKGPGRKTNTSVEQCMYFGSAK